LAQRVSITLSTMGLPRIGSMAFDLLRVMGCKRDPFPAANITPCKEQFLSFLGFGCLQGKNSGGWIKCGKDLRGFNKYMLSWGFHLVLLFEQPRSWAKTLEG
jgi:hypothetical protein